MSSVMPDKFWRSLPGDVSSPSSLADALADHGLQRRHFMKIMGASLALTGAGGCSRQLEQIVPYRDSPPESTYGQPVFYATCLPRWSHGQGVLVECNMGRPTKIEGHPLHPASLGSTDAVCQAAILEFWDPERSQTVRQGSNIATWDSFTQAFNAQLQQMEDGAGLHILAAPCSSPSLKAQIASLRLKYPKIYWHQWEPLGQRNLYAGSQLAFGAVLDPVHNFTAADVIVALDSDFLKDPAAGVRYARDFASRRTADTPTEDRNRLYVLETAFTLTGAAADVRVALSSTQIANALLTMLHKLSPEGEETLDNVTHAWVDAIVNDLTQHRGRSIIIAGASQPPEIHALVHRLNNQLGNNGRTVRYISPVTFDQSAITDGLQSLCSAMQGGYVKALIMMGVNPVYDAPADLDFSSALRYVDFKAHCGLYQDETAALCDWHLPVAHALESWGDLTAFDGTVCLQQPCIAPLYSGKSHQELLAIIAGESADGYSLFKSFWKAQGISEDKLADLLRDGVIPNSAAAAVNPRISEMHSQPAAKLPYLKQSDGITLVFVPSASVEDGRYANNAWLQELPDPLTRLAWDNAALIPPALASELGVSNEDVIRITSENRSIELPVWITPGVAGQHIVVALGYGRTHAGSVGTGCGVNTYPLRSNAHLWTLPGIAVMRTGKSQALASTQEHGRMEGRDIMRSFKVGEQAPPPLPDNSTLYPQLPQGEYAWALNIDLSSCIGCGACTVACQSENNIPTVGREQVRKGRVMHWIRVDRYYEGSPDKPRAAFQPVPCMQCEHAPCEVVCPVEASIHDSQGINVQVYNRCIGTRFCSNNCPYKVRRFNFLKYTDDRPTSSARRNPQVTVRMRGVMEKCNYCLQRITTARIAADRESRRLQDGEVVTACQAVCPTRAIAFGDLNDPASSVVRRRASPFNYALLAELNTRPRTTYLARIVNPGDLGDVTGGDPQKADS